MSMSNQNDNAMPDPAAVNPADADPLASVELPEPDAIGVDPVYAGQLPDENDETGREIIPAGAAGEVERINDYITFGRNFAIFERDTPFETWAGFFENLVGRLEFADRSLPWIIGDALNFALQHFPDDAYSQFLNEFHYSYGTLRNMAYVAGRWAPIDRDTSLRWSNYYITAGLRKDAPKLAAAMVKNAGATGATRRELRDQANQASRQVRADRKDAPTGQLDEPKIETEIHRPGCPSCTCVGPKKLGKPAKLSPAEARRAVSKRGESAPEPKVRRGRAAATNGTVIDVSAPKRGRKTAATVTAAPKPIGTRKGRRGRALEPNPAAVQIVGANDVADDAEPLNGTVFSDGDGGTFETVLEPIEDADQREPDPAGIA